MARPLGARSPLRILARCPPNLRSLTSAAHRAIPAQPGDRRREAEAKETVMMKAEQERLEAEAAAKAAAEAEAERRRTGPPRGGGSLRGTSDRARRPLAAPILSLCLGMLKE